VVEFATEADASAALIEMNNTELNGEGKRGGRGGVGVAHLTRPSQIDGRSPGASSLQRCLILLSSPFLLLLHLLLLSPGRKIHVREDRSEQGNGGGGSSGSSPGQASGRTVNVVKKRQRREDGEQVEGGGGSNSSSRSRSRSSRVVVVVVLKT